MSRSMFKVERLSVTMPVWLNGNVKRKIPYETGFVTLTVKLN